MRREMNVPMRALLAMLCLIAAGSGVAADIYRWTDENGQVHYGGRPAGHDAQRLDLRDSPARDAARDAASRARQERQRRVLEAYEYEREQKAVEAARAEEHDRRQAASCRDLQRRWRFLSFPGAVFYSRPDGTRDYLSDERRDTEKRQMRAAYVQACGKEPPQ